MEHNLPPAEKIPPVDLEQFVGLAKPKIGQMPILKRLRFLRFSEEFKLLKSISYGSKDTRFFEIVFRNRYRSIKIALFNLAGGYYSVSINRHDSMGSDNFSLSRYFELFDKDSDDRRCFGLRNYSGTLEKQIEESLVCLNCFLEVTFESVLEGDDWIDVPPSFYDYK